MENEKVYLIHDASNALGFILCSEKWLSERLRGKSWKVQLTPISNEECAVLYEGNDIDAICSTITPNWGDYLVTEVVTEDEPNEGIAFLNSTFGFDNKPEQYKIHARIIL